MKKELKIGARRQLSKKLAKKYQRARKKEKMKILDNFVELTGYNRNYAARLLRNWGKKVRIRDKEGNVVILEGERGVKDGRGRKRKYGKEVLKILKMIWAVLDCPCGKRLAAMLPEMVRVLEEKEELETQDGIREKLSEISPATIDRMLRGAKKKFETKPQSKTKPGSLLKSQIPVRTYADWDENVPGFMEMDLVSHDGGNASGEFAQTLDVTDIKTGWTEVRAVKNKAQVWVFEAIKHIREKVPFRVLGLDSDNGAEFINDQLRRYCEQEEITFTRSRPYRKNDNCYVEQKNWSVVRKAVGYHRYDTKQQLKLLNELYDRLRLFINYFQPQMKLIEKKKVGSKIKKKHDTPKTPYQRVLDSEFIEEDIKENIKHQYGKLNPVKLKKEMSAIEDQLLKLVLDKKSGKKVKKEVENETDFE